MLGLLGAVRGCRGVRECRHSGTRKDIGGIRGNWELLGVLEAVRGCQGCIGGWQGV